jgi:predicted nucleic acid-binding Zn ribbon protein
VRRGRPQPAGAALRAAIASSSPGTPLAAVQAVWHEAAGPSVAERAQPVAERDGVVSVSCESATWAQELDLMQEEVRDRVNSALAAAAPPGFEVHGLRFTADGARHEN